MEPGDTDSDPEVDLPPLQPPEALQLVALVVDQVSVEDCPVLMDVGLAERFMVRVEAEEIVTTIDLVTVVAPLPTML